MLEVRNLGVRYGRHQALDGASARIEKGEVCVILGANGAGKSSLLKAIAGMVKVEPGSEVVMNGRPIAGMKPHRIVEMGIALVPEGRGIFGDLTVRENLQLGAYTARARSGEAATLQRVFALFPQLAERRAQVVRTMSGGEQQMVAIGRALMSQPEILMLDEPSLGLSPRLTKELFRSLTAIAQSGVGILLVEQNARQSLKIADRGYLIEIGRITGEGSAQSLVNDPAVINAYLGGSAARPRPARTLVRLPPPFLLPAGLAAIGRLVRDLAARAGAIQAAFVRVRRKEDPLPSAFAGRYDPAGAGDPWDDLMRSAPQGSPKGSRVSADARRLSSQAAALARAAAERHARYIRTGSPSYVAASHVDPAALARSAAERMAEHVRRQRAARPLPSAFAPAEPPRTNGGPEPTMQSQVMHGALGHNSAGIADAALPPSPPAQALDTRALAARASAVMAAHVAERRKSLTMVILRRPTLVKTDDPEHP
ncbi:MAG: hypothetical protein BroJett024_18350 [Alphaproteobacteria bacterium]|nr:MAG: hypothetical protein BroJett024_18350 [Alphaproteobacteria bacterium]